MLFERLAFRSTLFVARAEAVCHMLHAMLEVAATSSIRACHIVIGLNLPSHPYQPESYP